MSRKPFFTAALSTTLIAASVLGGPSFVAAKEPQKQQRHMDMNGPGGNLWRAATFVWMLKQFDGNGDSKISKEEGTAGVEKLFDAIDANHDGSITPGEWRNYRKAEIQKAREARQTAAGDDEKTSNADDTKDKGKPNHPDRRHWQGRHGMMMAGMMRRMDTDENGQISKKEAVAAFDKLFSRLDTNKDGFVSIDDFPNPLFP